MRFGRGVRSAVCGRGVRVDVAPDSAESGVCDGDAEAGGRLRGLFGARVGEGVMLILSGRGVRVVAGAATEEPEAAEPVLNNVNMQIAINNTMIFGKILRRIDIPLGRPKT